MRDTHQSPACEHCAHQSPAGEHCSPEVPCCPPQYSGTCPGWNSLQCRGLHQWNKLPAKIQQFYLSLCHLRMDLLSCERSLFVKFGVHSSRNRDEHEQNERVLVLRGERELADVVHTFNGRRPGWAAELVPGRLRLRRDDLVSGPLWSSHEVRCHQ